MCLQKLDACDGSSGAYLAYAQEWGGEKEGSGCTWEESCFSKVLRNLNGLW